MSNSYTKPEDVDFSKYKIYIPKEGSAGIMFIANAGIPNAPKKQPRRYGKIQPIDKRYVVEFDIGVKILKKEHRNLWLPVELSNNDIMDYFKQKYNIIAM